MTHYVDIKVLNSAEISRFTVMNTLFEKFHKSLVDEGVNTVGASFPLLNNEHQDLGRILRLHGLLEDINKIVENRHLISMGDYTSWSEITEVPADSGYRIVRRVQSKSNVERLRRRAMKRHGITMEEAEMRIPADSAKFMNLPFLTITSCSSGQRFRLYIDHGEVLEKPVNGYFGCYGFSREASVPWF
jgi:CRISPR-associated endonuclease Csy4